MENSHVFDVEIVLFEAAGAVVAGLDQFSGGVEVVDDGICVLLLRSREHDHLEELVSGLEALLGVGPDVDAGVDRVWLSREVEGDDHIRILCIYIVDAVYQCLIEVEYNGLCLVGCVERGQID